MSANQQEVLVPGPLHPDLFNGTTPIMMRLPAQEALKVYEVHVSVSKQESLDVVASSPEEADAIALRMVEMDQDFDAEVEATWCRQLERTPDEEEILSYLNNHQEIAS